MTGLRLTIELGYSLYCVPAYDTYVSLAKNVQASISPVKQRLIREGKRQAKGDARILTLDQLDGKAYRGTGPLEMRAVIVNRVNRKRDDDGAILALASARDGMAEALGIDDQVITIKGVTFEKGPIEETVITLEGSDV